jgi:tetratricopeptide (TPR) repeat protein
VAGSLITALYFGRLSVSAAAIKPVLRSIVWFAGYNLIYGALETGIDNSAHLGGLVTGMVLGVFLGRLVNAEEYKRTSLYVFTGLALVLVLLAGEVRKANGYIIHLRKAALALGKGDHEGAIHESQATIAAKPRNPHGHFLLGSAYMEQQKNEQAATEFERALALEPRYADGWMNLGVIYYRLKRFDEARNALAKAISLNPGDADAQFNLGLVLEQMHQPQAAAAAYMQALKLNPAMWEAHQNLGYIHLEAKEYDAAIAEFSESLKLKPDNASGILGLAGAYRGKGMLRESQAAMAKHAELSAMQQTGK